ncbi:MAG: hypothetical protein ACOH5I_25125 [Oligoflexus sp.]
MYSVVQDNGDTVEDETQTDSSNALEPVAVGGSFLTCQFLAEESTLDTTNILCRQTLTEQSEYSKDISFSFASGFSRDESIAISPTSNAFHEDLDQAYIHWHFSFRRTDIIDSWIYVDITDNALDIDISSKVDIFIPPARILETEISPSQTMITFSSGPQKIGDDGAGRSTEAACVGIDVPGIANARSKSYQISLSVDSSINLTFSNLCGVGTGQINTTGEFTTAILQNDAAEVIFTVILENREALVYGSDKLAAGNYTLTISPASRNGGLNDFVYANLKIEALGMLIK